GSDLNFIQKSGAWYSVGSERIGQGRDNARTYLEEHPDLMAKLEMQILVHNGVGPNGVGPNGVLPVANAASAVGVASAASAAGIASAAGVASAAGASNGTSAA